MQYLEIIYNYFQTLVFAESASILKQSLASLSTNQFGLYFSAVGISLSSMTHFNKKLSELFDTVVLVIFHRIRWLAILLTILVLLPIFSIISYDLYQKETYLVHFWNNLFPYQRLCISFISILGLIDLSLITVYAVKVSKSGSLVTALGLIITCGGFYIEMGQLPQFNKVVIMLLITSLCFILIHLITDHIEEKKKVTLLKKGLPALRHQPDNRLNNVGDSH